MWPNDRAAVSKTVSAWVRFPPRAPTIGDGMSTAVTGNIYRHFKTGELYVVKDIVQHTERDERLVLYENISNRDQITWARPLEMFESTVEKDGKEVERFEFVASSPKDLKKKFEVTALHTSHYYAMVEADTAEEARDIADTRNLIDEDFWHENCDSWNWEISDVSEVEDE